MAEKNTETSLSKVSTFALINELTKRNPEELKLAIFALLQQGKLKYEDISQMYVKYLETEKEDNKAKLSEGATCVIQELEQDTRDNHLRSLYFLNKIAPFFNVTKLNEKYGYNEKEGKETSFYEANKESL